MSRAASFSFVNGGDPPDVPLQGLSKYLHGAVPGKEASTGHGGDPSLLVLLNQDVSPRIGVRISQGGPSFSGDDLSSQLTCKGGGGVNVLFLSCSFLVVLSFWLDCIVPVHQAQTMDQDTGCF